MYAVVASTTVHCTVLDIYGKMPARTRNLMQLGQLIQTCSALSMIDGGKLFGNGRGATIF